MNPNRIDARLIQREVLIETDHRFIYVRLSDIPELIRLLEEIIL